MAGLVWFVQVVHYPLLARVPIADRPDYARDHARRTTWLVAPLMLVELATALALALAPAWHTGPIVTPPAPLAPASTHLAPWMTLGGLALLALLWASTFLVQVPLHAKLQREQDLETSEAIIAALVRTNTIRTALWTARAALALAMMG